VTAPRLDGAQRVIAQPRGNGHDLRATEDRIVDLLAAALVADLHRFPSLPDRAILPGTKDPHPRGDA
jgi:hypothetical protein